MPGVICNDYTTKQNKFYAHISDVKTSQTYQGTVLFPPTKPEDDYISDAGTGAYEGIQALQQELYDRGYRILEVKYFKTPFETPHWDDTHSCAHFQLAMVLNHLNDTAISGTNEKWWPPAQADRYAFGHKSGQIALQFTIDHLSDSIYPFIKMNRVTFAGGANYFSVYSEINCAGQYSNFIAKLEREFPTSTTVCINDLSCGGDTDLALHLYDDSSSKFIGDSNDGVKLTTALFNTGLDYGCHQEFNNDYYDKRSGTKAMWDIEEICDETLSEGVSIIDEYYDITGNVDDWVEFYVSGYTTFNPTCP